MNNNNTLIKNFSKEHDLLEVSTEHCKDYSSSPSNTFTKIKIRTPRIATMHFGESISTQKHVFKQITCFSDKAYAVSDSTLRTFISLPEALQYVLQCFDKENIPTKTLNSIKFITTLS